MRLFSKTALLMLTITVAVSIPAGASSKMIKNQVDLPKTIGVWTRQDSVQIVDSKNIFKYMNGAGELYLAYRFNHLAVHEYIAANQENILVELYFMKTSDDAFGLLSLDWGGEPVISNDAAVRKGTRALAPLSRAFYGRGLLRICSDNIYARIMASRETPASKEAVISLGRVIALNRKNPPEPGLLNILPHTVGSQWKLRSDRIGYLRSYLVLNSLYYLSHQNILNLNLTTEAVTAPYEYPTKTNNNKRIQFLLVKYSTPVSAQQALHHFHRVYLSEHKKPFPSDSISQGADLFKIEDGWMGYKLYDVYIVFVFECPDQESARMIIEQMQSNLKK
jgi:hypothetical protein